MFTPEYFFSEVTTFRKLMGEKSFWADPNKVHNAKHGLSAVYFNTQPTPEVPQEKLASVFQSTLSELLRRALLIGFDIDLI